MGLRRWMMMTAAMQGAGAGAAPLLPFSDDFARSDGDLANGWEYTAGKWTIAGAYAVGTPGLGANLLANPGFDADTDWFKEPGWSIAGGVGVKVPDVGNKGIRQTIAIAGDWHRVDWTLAVRTAGTFWSSYQIGSNTQRNAAATYVDTQLASLTSKGIEGDAASDGSIDDVTAKKITLADMFCVRDLGSSDIEMATPMIIVKGTRSGLVACLDDKDNPANFLLAIHNGTNATLLKCVGGTYTQLINAAAAYADGRSLAIIKSGTDVSLYYNDVQIGTMQTVSDAGIISNTLHGMFSTAPENSFAEFAAVNP